MMLRCVLISATLLSISSVAYCHGFLSEPRMRGSLKTQRDVDPKVYDEGAPIDYCPHCLNAGGTGAVGSAGPYTPYTPMKGNKRGGFGICGDKVDNDDHMKTGKFANPKSWPFAANYKAGSVANFEFDATTNHGGFLQFWLCDVSKNPNQDIQFSTFPKDCHYLKRVAVESCESGKDKGCGPIDKRDPGNFVIPCRTSEQDQIVGKGGKMAYRIPDVKIDVGVVHMYWATRNSCTDDFMNQYNYPEAWAGCPGDGGSVGGKPQTTTQCSERFPEEFWNCADVQIAGGKPSQAEKPATTAEPAPAKKPQADSKPEPTPKPKAQPAPKTSPDSGKENTGATTGEVKEDGNCYRNWHLCQPGGMRCCKPDYVCAPYYDSPLMCAPPKTSPKSGKNGAGESGKVEKGKAESSREVKDKNADSGSETDKTSDTQKCKPKASA